MRISDWSSDVCSSDLARFRFIRRLTMRFKKPQVRYADTPQPATPYQAAGQVWDDRIGTPRVPAKNWRLMAFGCLQLALLMEGGLVWGSAQSIVTPYGVGGENESAGRSAKRGVGEEGGSKCG